MKKLTRMKLINWHRFTNCTIEFGSSTLISGENGAGKSTLLDAVQFVITCSANHFNKAAHDNGKRKLAGYIRCKTGRENKPYERTGQISAHVALEFYEESKKRYFIIGAVVDSASENQETTVRYLIDNQRMTDEMFLNGSKVKSITEFHASNREVIKQWCKTQRDARKMVLSRLGRIESKFFRLIPKALAFRPIDDIKDFVYSYVLDEKEVNVDVLRENVRAYQDLERTLESVRSRMKDLEQIERHYNEVQDCIGKDRRYEYFLQQAETDIVRQTIRETEDENRRLEFDLQLKQTEMKNLTEERDERREIATNLRVELRQDQEFLALEEQKKELERLEKEREHCREDIRQLKQSIKKALGQAKRLSEIPDPDPCIPEYRQQLEKADENTDVAELKALTERVISYKTRLYGEIQQSLAEVRIQLKEEENKRRELNRKIEQLERKKLTYPDGVERLLNAIREEFAEIGRASEPRVLCELLDIRDESWRDAVEGYLNTQRFHILVEPENFDIALSVYDRIRREKKAYGVGLINAYRMDEYDTAPEGSLATVVTSKNKYAGRYINMLLGKVMMCERYEDLKKYPVSITRECMRYQNRVASAIKPEVFRVPFIGRNAFKVQLEQAKQERKQLDENIAGQRQRADEMEKMLESLGTETDFDVKHRLDAFTDMKMFAGKIKNCMDNISTLEKNSTLIQKQIELEQLDHIVAGLENDIQSCAQQTGAISQRLSDGKERREQLIARQLEQEAEVERLAAAAGDEFGIWQKRYRKETESKTYDRFRDNYSRQRVNNSNRRVRAEEQMKEAMMRYNSAYDFGASANLDGYYEYAAMYDRLRTSELLEYEEKVQSARQAAEDEFREQFLAKLQENMKQAQSDFKDLNRALKDITFSNEKYEFLFMPSKKYRSYYEMIMDDFNVIQGESIFSGVFHETHKEVIEELFERLALGDDNSENLLTEFTDYRTYMDYDIKIIHTDGSFSYYSKVCEEKSGGETQTPFYVTVAASFVQLYGNNIGGEAAGLVLFDEAFNNMDDERIGGVLEFLKRLPLQIIVAAPPDKIQYIGPETEETLLVMTDERVSYVETYHNAV